MNVRLVVVSLLVMLANGCTCAGCDKTPEAPPVVDAGLVAKVEAPAAADAGARELPYEVTANAVPDAELIAKYAADCHAEILVKYDDMDGEIEKVDCDAIATDQNCSPDTFGCWDAQEKCTDECRAPCGACQAKCAQICDACKDGKGKDCAKARFECRNECLYAQSACRSSCAAEGNRCYEINDERVKKLCPDCDAINKCLFGDLFGPEPVERKNPETCLKAGNAHECIEWCTGI